MSDVQVYENIDNSISSQALFSLRKYPLELKSGAECLILKNFGRQLCAKLDKKLAEYRQNNPSW